MRRAGRLLIPLLAAGTVVVPVLTPVSAAPHPVAGSVRAVEVTLGSGGPALAAASAARDAAVTRQSEPVEAERFSLVGVSWSPRERLDPETVRIEVRTRDASAWGPWQALSALDNGPDAGTAEAAGAVTSATSPLWVGPASEVQTRVTADSPAASVPDALTVHLVDPGTSSADDVPAEPLATADAAASAPAVVSRAQWGADETKRNCAPTYNATVKAAVVHHTAGSNAYSTRAQAIQQLRADYAYHTDVLGWCDLGYNAVVDRFGTIYEGRAGGLDEAVMGSHAGGFNADTFGVSALGNFSLIRPPAALVDAIARLVAWKLGLHDRNPLGTVTLTSAGGGTSRYSAGTQVTLPVVMGHRNVGLTECPGTYLYSELETIRDAVVAVDPGAHCPDEEVDPARIAISSFSSNVWSLRREPSGGASQGCFAFGLPTDTPLWGDFDGNGTRTPVVFRQGRWFYTASRSAAGTVRSFTFGRAGDRPVIGDWNRDGTESPGVFRPSTGQWYLVNDLKGGTADGQFGFGSPGDLPVVGDWNEDRTDTLGVFRPSDGTWYLTNALKPGQQSAQGWFGYGQQGDQPVVGDWNGDGTDTPGVVRPAAGVWYLTDALTPGTRLLSTRRFDFGQPGAVGGVWR